MDASNAVEVDPADLALKSYYLAHGSLMFLAFGVFLPLGVVAIKALDPLQYPITRHHVRIHSAIQAVGFGLATAGAAIAYARFAAMDTMHGRIGAAAVALVWAQPFGALLRPKLGAPLRPYWFALHWLVGTTIIVLGWANIFFGIDIYRGTYLTGKARPIYILFGVWIGLVGTTILFLDKILHLRAQAPAVQCAKEANRSVVEHSSKADLGDQNKETV